MKKELTGVAARVLPIIEDAVKAEGCFIWDIDYVREGADRILRVTIDTDREGGVGIDDCERVHHTIDPLLDEADPIDCSYYLQISSPGIERDITLPAHVDACVGEKVEARLFAPVGGRKVITGTLLGFDGEGDGEKSADPRPVLIDAGGERIVLPYESISKMKILFDFGS
ncbi:MAG: ribosome maturation factor RimP [Clostridia bacterium]|nr:ribosome maturation factor RimP [Clostridia bacterium]